MCTDISVSSVLEEEAIPLAGERNVAETQKSEQIMLALRKVKNIKMLSISDAKMNLSE